MCMRIAGLRRHMLSFTLLLLQVLRGNIRETSATIGLHTNVEISIILDQGDELSR